MDNILKLLLGVLSVAGLIAMLTPTDMAVTPPTPAVAVASPAAVAPMPDNGEAPPVEEEEVVDEVADDPFSSGEPTIDGNPINMPGQNQQGNPNPDAPQQAMPSFDPATYGIAPMPNYAAPMPPVYNVPIGPDGYATVPSQ